MTTVHPLPRVYRLVAAVMLPCQLWLGLPSGALGADVVALAKPTVKEAFQDEWVPPGPRLSEPVRKNEGTVTVVSPTLDRVTGAEPGTDELKRARVLRRNLRVLSGQTLSTGERRAVAGLLKGFEQDGGHGNPATSERINQFLQQFPGSGVRLSLLLEKAEIEWKHGYFEKSVQSLKQAWEAGRDRTELEDARLAEEALDLLLGRYGQLGRREELKALLKEIEGRRLGGQAQEAAVKSREILWHLENKAAQNIFCGFTAANEICVKQGLSPIFPDVDDPEEEKAFVKNGVSLYDLKVASKESSGDLVPIKRTRANVEAPVPSIMHWKFGHFSALTERENGGERVRVKDFHLKFDSWVSPKVIRQEGSGYYMVRGNVPLPEGFVAVSDDEAKTVFGRHCTHARDNEGCKVPAGGNGSTCPTAMASYNFGLLNPGLMIADTPIMHRPAFGPEIAFHVQYDQRSSVIPNLSNVGNFGPRWSHGYAARVDIISNGTPPLSVQLIESGSYFNYSYNTTNHTYASRYADLPQLDYLTAANGGPGFQLTFQDGSRHLYKQPDSATPTAYYLTQMVDTFGNALTLQYDSQLRITALVDALGHATTISYTPGAGANATTNTTLIRAITDPFGRTATFQYTTAGQLWKITDPEGIVSEFHYAASDFIDRLTTPYGTHTFAWGELPGINSEPGRWIEATDPYGDKERAEANDLAPIAALPNPNNPWESAPSSVNVNGTGVSFLPKIDFLNYRNTFYWDKKQMAEHAGDYTQARLYNFLAIVNTVTGTLASIKDPLEGRTWFNYPGQISSSAPGTINAPSKVVRPVEGPDGTLQWVMSQTLYDTTYGIATGSIDALGREMRYEYDPANHQDLTAVKVKIDGVFQTVATFSNYIGHQPQTTVDASGVTTQVAYNVRGQTTQVTKSKGARSETVQYNYNAITGFLESIQATPPSGSGGLVTLATFTSDAAGRVHTATDTEGYTVTYNYDNFDRTTLITHPDGSTEQFVYENLDLVASKDRAGRWTRTKYNALRQPAFVQDAQGRVTSYEWCKCGSLSKLYDPDGKMTFWKRDVQGRVSYKQLSDGRKYTYNYQPLSGRLGSVIYPADQAATHPTITYAYNLDGTKKMVGYASNTVADVSLEYNDPLGRLSKMTDGVGATTYSYIPFDGTSDGAGKLYEVNGPWANDTVRYTYDFAGRSATRQIRSDAGAVLSQETVQADALGRLARVTNNLGAFQNLYNAGNFTNKVDQITRPAGLSTALSYFPSTDNTNRGLLQSIQHQVGATTLSKFDYTYQPGSFDIATWKRQLGPNAATDTSTYSFGYDYTDQLQEADLANSAGVTTQEQSFRYDRSGNRMLAGTGSTTALASYAGANQLQRVGGAGSTMVEGELDKRGNVTVNGQAAVVAAVPGTGKWQFWKQVPVQEGNNTLNVTATDVNGNVRTNNYQITVSGVSTQYTYDSNGNTTNVKDAAGTVLRHYEWDTLCRLLAIQEGASPVQGAHRTEFSYDGTGRRVRQVEKTGNGSVWVPSGNHTFQWCGMELCQQRDASGATVQRNYFDQGEERLESGTSQKYYYTKDHLGSVREVVDATGTLVARYDYDVWGKRTQLAGTFNCERGFTGHWHHGWSNLIIAPFRIYDVATGRWLSEDPIGEEGGINLYGYAHDNPQSLVDPYGLDTGEAIAKAAEKQNGSGDWAFAIPKDYNGANTNKCSQFVGDTIKGATGKMPFVLDKDEKGRKYKRYPSADEWADPKIKIPGWSAPRAGPPKRGDVAAYPIPGIHPGFTGHCGIVTDPNGSAPVTSAHDKNVFPKEGQFTIEPNLRYRSPL